MGLYNYVGKFIPHLPSHTKNIHKLLKKNGPQEDQKFEHVKMAINTPSLSHFDKHKLILQCNLLLGICISRIHWCAGELQIELLDIYYGCKRFEYLLLGRSFIIQNDHHPLLSLIKKPLCDISPRLQKLDNCRHISRDTNLRENFEISFREDKQIIRINRVDISDEKLAVFREEAKKDHTLNKIIKIMSFLASSKAALNLLAFSAEPNLTASSSGLGSSSAKSAGLLQIQARSESALGCSSMWG
ncbi:K02A2.6-like [Cordylochernes scorpioides]|uniref:K02A2.6-like n=1 Tax=Cordylochernes scorpioides TaxID=51811 RepID=A0ABY6KL44_9ARAC|nr:K02A2.6-like [Cordylochernes scorpioides]